MIQQGLQDLKEGRESIAALLVCIGEPRLRRLGFTLLRSIPEPEFKLYDHLAKEFANGAHSKYNSDIRRLVSF